MIVTSRISQRKFGVESSMFVGFVAILAFFILSALVSYWNTASIRKNQELITQTHQIILQSEKLLSLAKDAETGQRGYLITGDEKYLVPYADAVTNTDWQISQVRELVQDNPRQITSLSALQTNLTAKLNELNETITLRRTKGFDAARDVVVTDRGKKYMDSIRHIVGEMDAEEERIRQIKIAEIESAYKIAVGSNLLCTLFGILLLCSVAMLIQRNAIARQKQQWLQEGQVGLSKRITGESSPEELGENILTFLSEYMGAYAGAFYAKDKEGYHRTAVYGLPDSKAAPLKVLPKEGLLGQALVDRSTFLVKNVPDGYLQVGSALGKGKPKSLIIATPQVDGLVNAVFELGFFDEMDELHLELIRSVSESIAIAVRSANYRVYLQNLLEETQTQAEELQTQSEELRVTNEELQEQSSALKLSQASLEQQQHELEQTNSQLEEQTQLLEQERDNLNQTGKNLQHKTFELEQSNRYKSDFLANMSHELRTPLNSSLILAKLLADNPAGNLDAEQVKFAQNIQSAGNDLLNLINDILDLSKIEAGHMEVLPEPVHISRLVDDMQRTFKPLAKEHNLAFDTEISPGCPPVLETDRQRLEQILKNLLSNGLKFTERGSVKLNISRRDDNTVAFAVSDTGIGISPENQQSIFEAFRQADSTISRKYGGTGLGLSISRELTRLLGGTISVASETEKGSTFTIVLPLVYNPDAQAIFSTAAAEFVPHITPAFPAQPIETKPKQTLPRPQDDREILNNKSRTILIVEDDIVFARILYDIAHEVGFQCIIATNAEEAIIAARQYKLNAILLDVVLPDHLGLTVIDRLKQDTRTRHIPIHVVSAGDYRQTALSMGAIGYMLKPIQRETLIAALKKLETTLEQKMRQVLIVEDDPRQRESLNSLLASQNVTTHAVGTVAECLEELKNTTYDCMVLDLSLPDASGYSLLETLSSEDRYSFPPVIVYTGRDLSVDEEQKLRRYSKSIIIKGAKSPERLLDEVTLFLHQVVSDLPPEQQRMLEKSRNRNETFQGRHILLVEDDIRNVYAISSILEPHGAKVHIARNGHEALSALKASGKDAGKRIDLVLMDVMMPEMDGITAVREMRKNPDWKKLPVIMLTAKAMKEDQERCLEAGANDYMAKPLDVEKLLSLVRVWLPR